MCQTPGLPFKEEVCVFCMCGLSLNLGLMFSWLAWNLTVDCNCSVPALLGAELHRHVQDAPVLLSCILVYESLTFCPCKIVS